MLWPAKTGQTADQEAGIEWKPRRTGGIKSAMNYSTLMTSGHLL